MSLFYIPEFPKKQKNESQHPWAKIIKDRYSSTYKYGHNSVTNPIFPPKKDKVCKNRIKFTLVGNRISRDFIYCYYLVKGLHKYRGSRFEAPIIRGVTSVEWHIVLSDLRHQYGGLPCFSSDAIVIIDNQPLGGKKELDEYIRRQYVYHVNLDYVKEGIQQFANYIKSSGRPCAYLNITVNGAFIGSLIFMLYSDIVPLASKNFLKLCGATKGGYTGTPIHRIVKDGWIQCGGYGLKGDSTLHCENFIVPHDKRGVLCMANDGRDRDCSTQFFVLLQPAPWMAHKYVAFGQLIEGDCTLKKIEDIPTWYESPTAEVVICQAGVFNMDCHQIPINKHTRSYLNGHLENLYELGEKLYKELLQRVFVIVQINYLKQLEEMKIASEGVDDDAETEIYAKKKTGLQDQLEQIRRNNRSATHVSDTTTLNNEFDVDVYEYEFEVYQSTEAKMNVTPEIVEKPGKIFYTSLTDVPYPGEVDSTFNLKKLLQGDYCLERDIEKSCRKRRSHAKRISVPPDVLGFLFDTYALSDDSDMSMDSNDELEIATYLDQYSDRASFAGRVVKKMSQKRKKYDIFNHERFKQVMSRVLADEELRIYKVGIRGIRDAKNKKVSIAMTTSMLAHGKIKRRQTGYINTKDLQKIQALIIMSSQDLSMKSYGSHDGDDVPDSDNDDCDGYTDTDRDALYRKIRHAPTSLTSYNRPLRCESFALRSSTEIARQRSALTRLYDDVILNKTEETPTLKQYKPYAEWQQKSYVLLSNPPITSNNSVRGRYNLPQVHPRASLDHVLSLQHGSEFRKISSDYVKTIDTFEKSVPKSIRTNEFAKKRPSLTVQEYRLMNEQYQENMKKAKADGCTPATRYYQPKQTDYADNIIVNKCMRREWSHNM